MLPTGRAVASPTCSHCLTALARAKLFFFLIQCELLAVVGPVELWATRWRRPSAAANPQGFCWPATPPLSHFVTRVMLIRLFHWPPRKIGREEIRRGNSSAS